MSEARRNSSAVSVFAAQRPSKNGSGVLLLPVTSKHLTPAQRTSVLWTCPTASENEEDVVLAHEETCFFKSAPIFLSKNRFQNKPPSSNRGVTNPQRVPLLASFCAVNEAL